MTSQTAYLLTTDDFDNSSVIGVYASQQLAKEAQVLWFGSQIEPTDFDEIPDHPPGKVGWHVTLRTKGGISSFPKASRFNPNWVRGMEDGREYFTRDESSEFVASCWAANEDEAIKIVKGKYDDFQARKMVAP